MTDTLSLLSPAKLNVFLHIIGRRADGYHNLQTVFQLLDHGDTITFSARQDSQVFLQGSPPGLAVEDNLIVRAARALQARMRTMGTSVPGADITLHKRLPLGGGLGGGSSNAATTLVALNHLWNASLDRDALMRLGRELGADVPLFIFGRTAWAEGVGDELTPLTIAPKWYLVVVPNCQVSTARIFSHKDLTRDTAAFKVAAFSQGGGQNDCQNLVRRLYPEVDKALIWLEKISPTARMTGTGACVFASFDSQREAERVLAKMPAEFTGFTARSLDRSPYYDLVPASVSTGA